MGQPSPTLKLGPRRILATFCVVLGAMMLLLGLAFPWVAGSAWLAIFLISLPCVLSGALALVTGWGLAQARLALGEQGLDLRLPSWRGFLCPPSRTWHLAWDQIQALERHTVLFRTFIMIGPVPALSGMAVVFYVLQTEQGRLVLPDKTLPRLAEAMALLAARLGLSIHEAGSRNGSLLQALLRGKLPVG